MNLKYWTLFFVAFTCACVSAEIHAIVIGELSYSIISNEDKTVDVALVNKSSTEPEIYDLVIPSSVEIEGETYHVTGIHKRGFRNVTRVYNSIEVPSSVKVIGSEAFSGIKNINEIRLHEGLETIGERAFYQSSISNPIDVPSSVRVIGDKAFYWMRNIKEIILHEGLDSIGNEAFYYTPITKMKMPSTATRLGEWLFRATDLQEIEWPENLTKIPDGCFSHTELSSFDFTHIKEIGDYGFSGCEFLDNVVIPSGCLVGSEAFSSCKLNKLTFEELPPDIPLSRDNQTFLDDYSFWGDALNLKRLVLPRGLLLNIKAFKNCRTVRTIEIHDGVKFYAHHVFVGGDDYDNKGNFIGYTNSWIPDSIIYLTSDPEKTYDVFQDVMYEQSTLYVKPEALEKVKNTFPWNQFKKIEALSTGVEDIYTEPAEGKEDKEFIYTLEGVLCGSDRRALSSGIYIVRRNGKTSKIAIR